MPYKEVKARAASARALVAAGGGNKNGGSTSDNKSPEATAKQGSKTSKANRRSKEREAEDTLAHGSVSDIRQRFHELLGDKPSGAGPRVEGKQQEQHSKPSNYGADHSGQSPVNGHSSRPSGSFGGGRSGLLNAPTPTATNGANGTNGTAHAAADDESEDPNAQLQLEMMDRAGRRQSGGPRARQQQSRDDDVEMTG